MPLRALFSRKPPEPQAFEIHFDNATYPVRVRRSRQARRYTLRIHTATREVMLTLPIRASLRDARAFAEKHGGWIAARFRRLPQTVAFAPDVIIPLRGVPHRIVHRPDVRGTAWTEAGEGGEPLLCVAGATPHLARRIGDYLKREARCDIEAASRKYAAELGVTVKRVSLRDQASRWGSCSTAGSLSYSWRLIFAPPFVLDYLAAHEVAHLVEMNHSRRFWRVLERICPAVAPAKAWLDAHGPDLHRYGA